MRGWWIGILLAIAACGPSRTQIKTAKLAQYTAPPTTLFEIARDVASRDYQIGSTDVEGARFATAPQFYNRDGGRESPGAGNFVNMSEGSIMLTLVVEVLNAEGGTSIIAITPRAFQVLTGSPKPRELSATDPNLPGWVHGRVDALAVAIYEAAKQHAAP